MPSLKDVKTQITGVKKTSQITKAMNMVSAAKLRGAQQKMEDFRPYAGKFNEALGSISSNMKSNEFPLMQARDVNTIEIIIVTSDRGLCGSFNANIIKMAEKLMNKYEAEGKKVSFVCIGKKSIRYFKKTGKVRKAYADIMGTFQMFNAREIAQDVAANFIAGEADEVQLVFGSFVSVARQVPTTIPFLPVQPIAAAEEAAGQSAGQQGAYTYEPSPEEIMNVLLPLYMNVMVYNSMLEVGASEQAARMTAMDNATNACNDIVANLTMIYNKARQAAITGDLMDIVGGAEALKG
ncbi:MAG: ATP synthase F1 subunit gamma [Desulfobulbaceae bacterium]|uniref:ATP synthase gamma chain n=1 Tax=Candidatus Desulfobia pelagia TaxID=2841692 RepID=A0A8J6NAH8_9BACT|nr:ATP synthase F1 subunit gamma [Candidatus Desulfobia pelagia]